MFAGPLAASVRHKRKEVAAVWFEQLARDPELTGHDRDGRGTAWMMDVEVARHPVGVGVELDRAHGAGADQRRGEIGGEERPAGGPHAPPARRGPPPPRG